LILGAALIHADGRTDRETKRRMVLTELICALCDYANEPKIKKKVCT